MKVNEWAGVGNHLDYGARGYDPRRIGWLTTDPLAAKYPGISPYVFCLDNPIIFRDGDGRVVVGSDGKPVTYTKDDKGTLTWSSNATEDIKTIGGAMIKTSFGEKCFQNWQNSEPKVHLKLDTKHETDYTGKTVPGGVGPFHGKTEDGHYKSVNVTIYSKSIDKAIEDGSGSRFENSSYEEALGTTGCHEEGHCEPAQIKLDAIADETRQWGDENHTFGNEIEYRKEYHEKNPGMKNENTWNKDHAKDKTYSHGKFKTE